ncbi:MAG: DnaD domain protein [Oscillospiraceae bacterium]
MYHLSKSFNKELLPAPLADRYRMADGPALKVALFLLSAGKGTVESIADALSMPCDTVERALVFWQKSGLISDSPIDENTMTPMLAECVSVKTPKLRERTPVSPERVSELSLRNPDIAVLLQEAQRFLGRTLDSVESRTLLEIYEYDELPVDVILLLVAYCLPRVKNKRAMVSMVSRIAEEWFELGITSSADAEEQIKLLELREQRENEVCEILELKDSALSKSQKASVARWFEEYNFDISFVREAYLVKGNNSIAYINKILQNWFNSGFKSLKEVRTTSSNAPVPSKQKKGGGSLLKKAVMNRSGKDE